MYTPLVYSDFRCIEHRGGFGSMQRLTQEFAPVRWVEAKEAEIGLFWHDGLLSAEQLAAFDKPKVLFLAGSYARAQAPPGSPTAAVNRDSAELARLADGICHVSQAQRDFFLRFIAPDMGTDKPFHIFPPMFDPDIFHPPAVIPAEPTVVATAFWRDWYRWLSVFEGFAALLRRVPTASLILGGGWVSVDVLDVREAQVHVARELGIESHLKFRAATGATHRDECTGIANALREGTVFVHARYADWGTLTGVEAIACGLPVVCGDNGGLPELLGDCAITLPYRSPLDSPVLGILDPEELGEAMWRAHAERIERRPRCVERAKRYEARNVLTNLVGWMRSFIK